ncbi:MAG: putative peptidoglycan glycosyltransferase FtsW [Candidatus Paceibacterota bacterium]|jgi:cell division protein FtsW|nr:putative lipid II flippase FtsW [Candidatus Paceibacterota bacterium]
MTKSFDKIFLGITLTLVLGGFFLFLSASLGLLARTTGETFQSVFVSQIVLGLFLGSISLWILSRFNYKHLRRFSFYLFLAGIIACILVFVPYIGFEHGGAKRWLDLRFTTFQPSELLKLGFVLYLATWLASAKEKVRTFKYGTIPFLILLGIPAVLLVLQPDMGTFGVLAIAGMCMFFAAGGRFSHIISIILAGILAFFIVVHFKPYLQERIDIFLNPDKDPQGSGYQMNQSLIAVGSGKLFGRGFGQGIQKFPPFLPEPTSDSIFAVASEELGFLGSTTIVLLFVLFAMRGFHISAKAPDRFARLAVIGIVFLIVTQCFINIASMVGLFPLTGVPLLFISHGGTALLFALTEVGIILNISRHKSGTSFG